MAKLRIFNVASMFFNAIHENKILTKKIEFTVSHQRNSIGTAFRGGPRGV